MLLVDLSFKNKERELYLYTTDCQDEVLVMRAHGSLHMHQCSYNSQGYTGRATHLFNLPSHPGSLHSDPTGVQVGHDRGVRHERKSRTLWQKSIGNHWKSVEIWLEIRNQDPVEIRKSARNHKKSSRNNEKHPLFV